jgi:VanW like protein
MSVPTREPTRRTAAVFGAKASVLRLARRFADAGSGLRRFPTGPSAEVEGAVLAESITQLWDADLGGNAAELALTRGKVHNLRLAARRLDGIVVAAHHTFSFWRQVGRATRRTGYVSGRELREGCIVPTIGGGLCQLSNALYDVAERAGFAIVERHAHTSAVPGSRAAAGRDATVFWNYVDLRFRPHLDVRLEAFLTANALVVRFRGAGPPAQPAIEVAGDGSAAAPPAGCASCGRTSCFRHRRLHRTPATGERTAFLVDGYWPEYDAYIGSVAASADTLYLPIDGRRLHRPNYAWTTDAFAMVHQSRYTVFLRSLASRGVAAQGAERQRLMLAWADRLARTFAARLPHDATHLVVMQHFLPTLRRTGALGGRTYDVLMTGLPMRAVHAALDDAARLHPESRTLADFRADPTLLELEDAALAEADSIVTPHAAVAAMFGSRAVRLDWTIPAASDPLVRLGEDRRDRILFAGSTLGRKGAYEVRGAAAASGATVLLFGPDLEDTNFWAGIRTERHASFATAAAHADVVVLPAFVEAQPRLLLRARALGLPVVATAACGLGELPNTVTIPCGDTQALLSSLAANA